MIKVDKAEGCNILFCFATDCRGISNEMTLVAKAEDVKLNIEHTSKLGDLFVNSERLSSFSCVIIQQYVDVMNPITIDFFINIAQIINVSICCIFSEENRLDYQKLLYENKLYNCFFGEDAEHIDAKDLLNIWINGRTKEEAADYYNVTEIEEKYKKSDEIVQLLEKYKKKRISREEFVDIIDEINIDEYSKIILNVNMKDIKYLLESKNFYAFYNDFKNKFYGNNKKKNFVERLFSREKKVKYVGKKNIAVVSASPGAGATFIAVSLADIICKDAAVTYIEFPLNDTYMYYYLGYDLANYKFENIYKKIREDEYDTRDNIKFTKMHNISWIINTPDYKVNDWKSEDMFKLMYSKKDSDINILDVGYNMFQKSFLDIADQFYMIIVVVDSLIPNIFCDIQYLNMIKQQRKRYSNIKFVLNKYNTGVDDKQLKECIGVKPDVFIDSIEYKYLCDAVYNFKLATSHKLVRNSMEKSLKPVIKDIFK